jgi:hypothetical protein
MVHLTLAGLSEDGKRLLLVSDAGVEFTLGIDDRLRAALSGDSEAKARLGQLEIKMESVLRPRDIQARIRAGETPEAVAAAAQTSVDKIMPYAAPVLAEREHVALRAQRASLRRPAAASATASPGGHSGRTLGDAIGSHLRGRNVDPGGVTWDAWRREDGRWTLTATFRADERDGQGVFTFDGPGNYVSTEDDDARWLVGDGPAAAPRPVPDDDLANVRRRRLTAVPEEDFADELPLGEDAIDLVSDHPDETASLGAEAPVEAYLDEPDPVTRTSEIDRVSDDVDDSAEEPAAEADLHDDEPAARPPRRKGRASVPSWDEIMFGGGKHD